MPVSLRVPKKLAIDTGLSTIEPSLSFSGDAARDANVLRILPTGEAVRSASSAGDLVESAATTGAGSTATPSEAVCSSVTMIGMGGGVPTVCAAINGEERVR